MPTIKVSVTQKDIDQGVRGNAMTCPIARAAKRSLPNVRSVTHNKLIFNDLAYLILPVEAWEFVYMFDYQGPAKVKPLEFDLEVPIGFVTEVLDD